MLRGFLRDSMAYGVSAIVARGIGVLLVPLYTRVLAPADYGTIDMLVVFTSLVNLTVGLEVTQAVARLYPDAPTAREKGAYASTAFWFTLAAYSVFGVAAAAGAEQVGALLLDAPERRGLVRLAILSVWASGLLYFGQNQLRWELRAPAYAGVSVAVAVLTAAVSVLLVLVLRTGVAGVVWGMAAGNLAGAALALWLTRSSYAFGFHLSRLREMLRYSAPLVPSAIAVFVAMYVDRIAIKEMMALRDVGLFGVGYRVASLGGLLMMGFQGALTPLVFANHARAETPGQLARLFRWFVAAALAVALFLSLFATELVLVFATREYLGGARVVPLLAPAVLLAGMYVFTPGLSIAKRTGSIALVTVMGAVLNTGLNLALVPRLGIEGAALSTLLSTAVVFAAYLAGSQRLYPVPHRWGPLAWPVAAAVAAVAAGASVPAGTPAGIALKAAMLLGVAATALACGLVQPAELRRALTALRARLRGGRRRLAGEGGSAR